MILSFNRDTPLGFVLGVKLIPPANNLAANELGADAGVVDVTVAVEASFRTLAARFDGVCKYYGTGVRFLFMLSPAAVSSSSISGRRLSSMMRSASSSGLSSPPTTSSSSLPTAFRAHSRSILL